MPFRSVLLGRFIRRHQLVPHATAREPKSFGECNPARGSVGAAATAICCRRTTEKRRTCSAPTTVAVLSTQPALCERRVILRLYSTRHFLRECEVLSVSECRMKGREHRASAYPFDALCAAAVARRTA